MAQPRIRRGLTFLAAIVAASMVVPARPAAPRTVPRLDHVVVIVFENRERHEVVESGAARAFDLLARDYVDLTQYFAVTHPSLPNYLVLVSGSTHGIVDDCEACVVRGKSIGDLLTRAGRSWGAYAEGYPSSSRFVKHHVPFLYFTRDRSHVHPLSAFVASRAPAFALVVPDACHDMHDCSVATGDRWLARFVPPLLHRPRTAVFIVFDEGRTNEGGGGRVAAIVAGTAAARHLRYARRATHYTLLRTIEAALGVPPLGASARVTPLDGIWR